MPQRDRFHSTVRSALARDGWTITDDPFTIEYEDLRLYADLGAEKVLAAERGSEKIVVEIKVFEGLSPLIDVQKAVGQYAMYRMCLSRQWPAYRLYLAVSETAYNSIFFSQGHSGIRRISKCPFACVRPQTGGDRSMDTGALTRYADILQLLLHKHAGTGGHGTLFETIPVCDRQTNHFLLIQSNLKPGSRVEHIVFHARLHGGKIIIEWDGVEPGIARELIAEGVPPTDIVLAWNDSDDTVLSESAVA